MNLSMDMFCKCSDHTRGGEGGHRYAQQGSTSHSNQGGELKYIASSS